MAHWSKKFKGAGVAMGTRKFLKVRTCLATVLLASLILRPALAQPAVGYEDEEGIVQTQELSKIRFPILCLTNRKKVPAGYSSTEKETNGDPELFVRYCTVDAAKHVLGVRKDFVVEGSDGPKSDLDRFVIAPQKARRYVVFVHGYNLKFNDSLPAVAQLAFDVDRHSLPVLFSWPSGENPQYVAARDNSRLSGRALAQGLALLQNRAGTKIEIDVVCHSLGGETTLEALEELGKPEFSEVLPNLTFKNLVFIAPDVAVDTFREAVDWPIMSRFQRITLYADANDGVLKSGSQFLTSNPRIGSKRDFLHPRVETVDVTPLTSSWNPLDSHTSVLNKPVGLMDLFMLLKLDQPAVRRNTYWAKGIWLLRK